MSTRGDYTIVKDGHYYSCYQHGDMYPDGHPAQLLAEAADIARNGDWGDVIAGWTAKAWVDEIADEALPDSLDRVRAAAESHPDGDTTPSRWAYALRPRLSRAEIAGAVAEGHAVGVFDADAPYGNNPIYGHPSWRAAAAMPVMMKNHVCGEDSDRVLGVYVDADNREVVLVRYRGPGGPCPIAAVPMDDADALGAAASALVGWDIRDAPAVPTARPWSFRGPVGPDGVEDGMWLRPYGFPPSRASPTTTRPFTAASSRPAACNPAPTPSSTSATPPR